MTESPDVSKLIAQRPREAPETITDPVYLAKMVEIISRPQPDPEVVARVEAERELGLLARERRKVGRLAPG